MGQKESLGSLRANEGEKQSAGEREGNGTAGERRRAGLASLPALKTKGQVQGMRGPGPESDPGAGSRAQRPHPLTDPRARAESPPAPPRGNQPCPRPGLARGGSCSLGRSRRRNTFVLF